MNKLACVNRLISLVEIAGFPIGYSRLGFSNDWYNSKAELHRKRALFPPDRRLFLLLPWGMVPKIQLSEGSSGRAGKKFISFFRHVKGHR